MPLRLAAFNVENLFDRAKALNTTTWEEGRPVLQPDVSKPSRRVQGGAGVGCCWSAPRTLSSTVWPCWSTRRVNSCWA
jgi:hypothetical protein